MRETETAFVDRVVSVLRSMLPSEDHVPLHAPVFAGREWDYVRQCLDTGWVSSVGKFVDEFEGRLADYTGVAHAVAVVNGTSALHVSLLLAGVERGHEVLVPALTFVATANAVAYIGAIPHFVDSEEKTLGVDPAKLNDYLNDTVRISDGQAFNRVTGRPIKAVVPMHTFGHPVDLDPLLEVADRFKLCVVEDAAESLGSFYKGRHTGNFGTVAALSFNGNKIITTGGGGAILTNDPNIAKQAKYLTTTAKQPHPWAFFHGETGFNYRLPNINAALGCAQLEQLNAFVQSKRELARRYAEAFKGVEGLRVFQEQPFARSNYWLNALVLEPSHAHFRDDILKATNAAGIMTRPAWTLMPELPMYKNCPQMDLSVARDLARRLVNIPSSAGLAG